MHPKSFNKAFLTDCPGVIYAGFFNDINNNRFIVRNGILRFYSNTSLLFIHRKIADVFVVHAPFFGALAIQIIENARQLQPAGGGGYAQRQAVLRGQGLVQGVGAEPVLADGYQRAGQDAHHII